MYLSKPIPKVITVKPLEGYKIYLEFNDEIKGIVDLSYLRQMGVFAWWDLGDNFSKVYLDNCGAIAWNEDLDIDSLNCYLKIINNTFEEFASG